MLSLQRNLRRLQRRKNPIELQLNGLKNTNAVKYYVYRRLSTKRSYTRIATTTKPKYIDTKVKKNKKYYYKIKSIYSNTKLNSNKTPAYAIVIGK